MYDTHIRLCYFVHGLRGRLLIEGAMFVPKDEPGAVAKGLQELLDRHGEPHRKRGKVHSITVREQTWRPYDDWNDQWGHKPGDYGYRFEWLSDATYTWRRGQVQFTKELP